MAAIQAEMQEFERLISEEESEKSIDDFMTLAQFSQSKRSPSTPKPLSTVVVDHAERSTSYKQKRAIDNDKAMACALERAKEVQSNLDPEFPSLVKLMLHSHVTSGFWLGLPAKFCNAYLPKLDVMITLVDENGERFPTKYLVEKTGLSGGWRGFSIAHKLVKGDALVFQLVKATELQVYIIRAYGLAEIDGAFGLLNLVTRAKGTDSGKRIKTSKKTVKKSLRSLPLATLRRNTRITASHPMPVSNLEPPAREHSENDSEEVGSEVLEGIRFAETTFEFKDIKNQESFTIAVDGLIIDSELSEHVRTKYYELCCSQNIFLHDHLLEGINCKLVAGVISETVNIADAIRASTITTSQDEFATWDKSLKAFEQLGMNVGFLCARLQQLASLALESEQEMDLKRYIEAIIGRARANEEIRTLKTKLEESKEASKRFDTVIEALKVKAESHELKFQAEVNASW